MKYKIAISGLGGQHAVFAGKILVRAAELGGYRTIWLPMQVSEMRGNEASCGIVLSKEPLSVHDSCDTSIVMAMSRQAVLRLCDLPNVMIITDERYENLCGEQNVICLNTDICGKGAEFEGMGSLMMIGAMLRETDILNRRDVGRALREHIGGKAAERNLRAVAYGTEKARRKRRQREIGMI